MHDLHEHYVIGYAGRLSEVKGIRWLIQSVLPALRFADRVTLLVAGSGELETYVQATSKAETAVKYVGGLDSDSMASFLNAIDVLVVPSRSSPFSAEQWCRVAIEAVRIGVPIVATRSGALPEVLASYAYIIQEDNNKFLQDLVSGESREEVIIASYPSRKFSEMERVRRFAEDDQTDARHLTEFWTKVLSDSDTDDCVFAGDFPNI